MSASALSIVSDEGNDFSLSIGFPRNAIPDRQRRVESSLSRRLLLIRPTVSSFSALTFPLAPCLFPHSAFSVLKFLEKSFHSVFIVLKSVYAGCPTGLHRLEVGEDYLPNMPSLF